MALALQESRRQLNDRIDRLAPAIGALETTRTSIIQTKANIERIDKELPPISAAPYNGEPTGNAYTDRANRDAHNSEQNQLVADREAAREQRARDLMDYFEEDQQEPIEIMKKVYGYQEPMMPGFGSGGTGGGAGGPGYTPPGVPPSVVDPGDASLDGTGGDDGDDGGGGDGNDDDGGGQGTGSDGGSSDPTTTELPPDTVLPPTGVGADPADGGGPVGPISASGSGAGGAFSSGVITGGAVGAGGAAAAIYGARRFIGGGTPGAATAGRPAGVRPAVTPGAGTAGKSAGAMGRTGAGAGTAGGRGAGGRRGASGARLAAGTAGGRGQRRKKDQESSDEERWEHGTSNRWLSDESDIRPNHDIDG